MSIGDRIKTKRKKIGLTQKELAEKVGVTVQQINRLETGMSCNPRKSTLDALAKVFNCNIADFFLDDDVEPIRKLQFEQIVNALEIQNPGELLEGFDTNTGYITNKDGLTLEYIGDGGFNTVFPNDSDFMLIRNFYLLLNKVGKHEAAKRVEELTHIEKYTAE